MVSSVSICLLWSVSLLATVKKRKDCFSVHDFFVFVCIYVIIFPKSGSVDVYRILKTFQFEVYSVLSLRMG